MKENNLWKKDEEFHFPYQGQNYCVQVLHSILLRGYKCKILSMIPPFELLETPPFRDVLDAVWAAKNIIDGKNQQTI